MIDLTSEVLIISMKQGGSNATVSSTVAGDYINMENHGRVTFLLTTGTTTVGGKVGIRKAKNKSGASAAEVTSAWIGGKFYSTSAGLYAANSTASSGKYISVANSDDSKTLIATFDATNLSASYPYIGAYFKSAGMNAVIVGTYLLWQSRYQNVAMADATL